MDATLIPLPNELTTPPVTKMNFVGICLHKKWGLGRDSYGVIYRPNRRPNKHAKRYSGSRVIQGLLNEKRGGLQGVCSDSNANYMSRFSKVSRD